MSCPNRKLEFSTDKHRGHTGREISQGYPVNWSDAKFLA
ncbi:hypothetical protein M595_5438 [Lyngbya aestuarii BL J]|uniref:Uncharacterized protein n=1 Tax=Lyngbya aestuarii BL J TaxID=1348334 RepID=U7QBN5_9CYAN|nr:hypothetical protein M595_5438 [Lyngbya aestuarii BL J]